MNISKITSANAAKVYADANKKLGLEKSVKNDKQVRANEAAFEKGGINISREAKNLNVLDFANDRIKSDISNDSIPADRISQLKNLVQSGGYYVSTSALAAALIDGN